MRKILHSLLTAALAFAGTLAFTPASLGDTPTSAFLWANHASTVQANASRMEIPYTLDDLVVAHDGVELYGGMETNGSSTNWTNRIALDVTTRLTSSLTGYLTAWYSYAKAPTDTHYFDEGPSSMTKCLSETNDLELTTALVRTLCSRQSLPGVTDLYVVHTPITYTLKYELDGGKFPAGASHPETATYDQSFTVSAPVRDFYTFSGWRVNKKLSFNGPSNDVSFINLTTVNGAEVTIGATWDANPYPLQLSLGEGVAKIHYRVSADSAWLETTKSLTVNVDYGETWSAWAEAAYGWEGSGSGWDSDGVTSGTMTEAGDKFKPEATRKRFTVKAVASPSNGGSVTGGGTYEYETQVELTATPATGHSFAGWSISDAFETNASTLQITVVSATNIVANFTRNTYQLKLTVGDGVSNIWYRLGGTGDFTSVTETRKIPVLYGTTYECYATPLYGWSLSGVGSSEDNLASGTMPAGDVAFAPKPTKNKYRVQLGATPADAGAVAGAGSYEYGTFAYLTASAETGYRFVSWSDGSTENPYWYSVESNAVLTATFAAKKYELQLVVNEGIACIHYQLRAAEADEWSAWTTVTGTTALDVAYGTRYRVYADVQAGYTSTDQGTSLAGAVTGTIKNDGVVFAPSATKIVYSFTVVATTSPAEGGTTSVQPVGKFSLGETATVEATVKEGFTFVQWNETRSGVAKVSTNPIYVFDVTNDVSLVAILAKETYTVTFIYNLADGSEYQDVQTVAYGASAVEPPAEKRNNWSGHSFVSWDSSDWQSVKGDCTIRAVYAAGDYTVHFDANGGTGTMSDQTFTYGVYQNLSKSAFSRTGYTFAGWSVDATASSRQYADQQSVKDLTTSGTITLYAVWTPITYAVRYEPNGGTGDAYEEDHTYDEVFSLPESCFANTVPFTGWTYNNRLYKAGETVTRLSSKDGATVTFKATWGGGCKIRFDANYDGADPNTRYRYQSFVDDVEQALLANTFTRTGYTFVGWSKDADETSASTSLIVDQALYTNPADAGETLDLYAIWKPNTYQVVFDKNNPPTSRYPCTFDANVMTSCYDQVSVNKADDFYADYFLGWSTSTSREDLITGSSGGQFKNLTAIPGDHIRLYAIWSDADETSASTGAVVFTSTNGWEACERGGFTNATDGASLTSESLEAGTVTFAWRPLAEGDVTEQTGELTLMVGEGVAKIFYQLAGGVTNETTESATTRMPVGTTYRLWAAAQTGYTLTGAGSSAENPSQGQMGTAGVAFEPTPKKNMYSVSVKVDPAAGGTVTGGGTYEYGTTATLTATANEGYSFAGWSVSDAIETIASTLQITVVSKTNLVAKFSLNAYDLALTVGEGVEKIFYKLGDGATQETTETTTVKVPFGTIYKLWATAKTGYDPSGSGWSESDAVTGTMTTEGYGWAPDPTKQTYNVSVSADPAAGGTVTSGGTYEYGETVTLTATANEGYSFAGWSVSDAIETIASTLQITVVSKTNLVAKFSLNAYDLALTVGEGVAKIFYKLGDSTTQQTTETTTVRVPYGTTYKLWATAKTGYTLTGAGSSEASAVSGTMGTEGAAFAPKATKDTYSVSVSADPAAGGTVTGGGTYEYGETVTLTATANEGYSFAGWSVSDAIETIASTLQITVASATNLVAKFEKDVTTAILTLEVNTDIWRVFYRLGSDEKTAWSYTEATTNIQVSIGTNCQMYASIDDPLVELASPYDQYSAESPFETTMTSAGFVFSPRVVDDPALAAAPSPSLTSALSPRLSFAAPRLTAAVAEIAPRTWTQAERLQGTRLTVKCGEVALTNLVGTTSYDAAGGTCRWESVTLTLPTGGGALTFLQDAGVTNGAALYPCALRNVCWAATPEEEHALAVRFEIDAAKGCRIGGGAVEQGYATNKTVTSVRATEPTVVGTNGWDFAGWSTDGLEKVLFAKDEVAEEPLSSDTVFTAVFTPHAYEVRYANLRKHNHANPSAVTSPGGTSLLTNDCVWSGVYVDPVKIDEGTETAFTNWLPQVLVPGVYGWRDEATGVFTYTNAVTQAQWVDMLPKTNETVYTVTFLWGLDGECATNVVVARGCNATAPSAETVAVAGYVFQGWDMSLDNVKKSFETRAQYTAIRYPLTYRNLLGTSHDNPLEYTIEDTFTLHSPRNDNANLDFLGWTTNAVACTGIVAGTMGEITFDANWAYRVTYTRTAGDHIASIAGQASETAQKATVYIADEVGVTNAPAVTCEAGYSFAGWQVVEPVDAAARRALTDDDGYFVDAAGRRVLEGSVISNVTEALTLSAVATANVYTVVFEPNGGEGTMADQSFTYDVSQALATNCFAKEGETFAGWQTVDSAARRVYSDGEVVENLTTGGVVRLMATWQTPPTYYAVSFVAGDHVTLAGETEQSVEEGDAATCPAATPDKGCSFVGWQVADAASSSRQDIDDEGFLIDAAGRRVLGGDITNVTEALTLSAVATVNVYRITYAGVPAGMENPNPTVYTVESNIVFSALAADGERPFAGWTPTVIEAGTTGDVTVVAAWGQVHEVSVVASAGGTVALYDAAGRRVDEGMFVEGTNLTAVATASNGWLFAEWLANNPNNPNTQTTQTLSLSFTVSNDVALTAVFTQKVFAVTIDGCSQAVRYGECVTYETAASVTADGTNIVCTGWVGTGDVPAEGATNRVTFTVTQASTLTWLYETNYWVEIRGEGVGEGEGEGVDEGESGESGGMVALYDAAGKMVANPAWYRAGTNLTAVATAAEGWLFKEWLTNNPNNPNTQTTQTLSLSFTVTAPISLTAVFTQKVYAVDFELGEHLQRTGGGALEQVVAHGDSATLPTVENIGYYAFAGWQLADAASSSRSDIDDEGYLIDAEGRRVSGGTVEGVTEGLRFIARSVAADPYIAADVAAEYATKVLIDPIVVRCVNEPAATLKVTGLPTGLKFTTKLVTSKVTKTVSGKRVTTLVTNALPNSIYGTPSKSGLFTAAVTATLATKVGTKTVTTVVATTNLAFVVRAAGETVVRTEVELVDGVVPGKVTGQGVYAAGKKVTLKATANKGYVFSGWWLADSAPLSRTASFAIVVPENDVTYAAGFVTAAVDAASIFAGVNGMELITPDASGTSASTGKTVETNVSVGVYLEWPVDYGGASATTIAVTGLPSGLKFTAKPVTTKTTATVAGKRVTTVVTNVPANTIYGRPTTASKQVKVKGEGEQWTVVPSQIKVTVTTAGKKKAIGILKMAVEALPTALVGAYVGGATNEPAGSASVTLAMTGKISGKWISEGQTWTLTAAGFDAIETIASTGLGERVFVATNVAAKCGKEAKTLTLAFAVNDLGYGVVDAIVPIASDASPLFSATYVPWKTDATLKALAKTLKGKKFLATGDAIETIASTETMSAGEVTLAGTVGANGTVSVKGTFDVGATKPYAVTVSSTLVPVDSEFTRFELFVYYAPKATKNFAGYATTLRLAWDGTEFDIIK